MIYQHERKNWELKKHVRIILHGFHSHSWCHSISNYTSQPHLIKCSLRYAEDNISFTPLGSMKGKIYEWTFWEINNKKNRHSQHLQIKTAGCFLHYYISNTEWKCTAVEKEEMNQYTELPDLGVFFFLSLFACWLYLYLKINLSDFQVWKISNQFPSWWHVEE